MTWFKIIFSPDEIIEQKHIQLSKDFEQYYIAARAPQGLSLFAKRGESLETTTYFLPPLSETHCVKLLLNYKAERCTPLHKESLILIFGTDSDFPILFPENP